MSKFPLLSTYRLLAFLLAVILAGIGFVLLFVRTSFQGSVVGGLDWALLFWIWALGIGVVAELILLFLKIEDHLDHIKQDINQNKSNTDELIQILLDVADNLEDDFKRVKRDTSQNKLRQNVPSEKAPLSIDDVTLKGTVKQDTFVRKSSERHTDSDRKLTRGTDITLYGRIPNGTWVEIDGDGKSWVRVADLLIDGDVTSLPVVKPS